MQARDVKSIRSALNRISGQVRGVSQMVEDGRYCMARVETQILKSHAASCVEEAIASGDAAQQREKFTELAELFAKAKL